MHRQLKLLWAVLPAFVIFHLGLGYAADTRSATDQPPSSTSRSERVVPGQRVDLNTATEQQLEALPGIGPVTAKAIIKARPFRSVNELTNVTGIGTAKFATLKPHVTVSRSRSGTTATETGRAPAVERSSGAGRVEKASPGSSQKINLNTASKEELESLPEIGPARAQAIIEARPFKTPEDVMKVKGIKEGIYSRIKDRITVE